MTLSSLTRGLLKRFMALRLPALHPMMIALSAAVLTTVF